MRLHRFLFAKETKNPKTDFSICTAIVACSSVKTAYHMDFFRILPKETQKSWILRIRINPLNIHRVQINWIHNPFWILPKKPKYPFLDSESGFGFFTKKCTLSVGRVAVYKKMLWLGLEKIARLKSTKKLPSKRAGASVDVLSVVTALILLIYTWIGW